MSVTRRKGNVDNGSALVGDSRECPTSSASRTKGNARPHVLSKVTGSRSRPSREKTRKFADVVRKARQKTAASSRQSLDSSVCAFRKKAPRSVKKGEAERLPISVAKQNAHRSEAIDTVLPLQTTKATTASEPTLAPDIDAAEVSRLEHDLALEPGSQSFRSRLLFKWRGFWDWTKQVTTVRNVKKRLRVCESVSLGEKRFVALIQVDGERFLVGGSSGSLSTLAHLEEQESFPDVLRRRWTVDASQA